VSGHPAGFGSVAIGSIGMVRAWQFGAVRTDRGDQFGRRDLIAHLIVDARLRESTSISSRLLPSGVASSRTLAVSASLSVTRWTVPCAPL
jgi:hypothetical protein